MRVQVKAVNLEHTEPHQPEDGVLGPLLGQRGGPGDPLDDLGEGTWAVDQKSLDGPDQPDMTQTDGGLLTGRVVLGTVGVLELVDRSGDQEGAVREHRDSAGEAQGKVMQPAAILGERTQCPGDGVDVPAGPPRRAYRQQAPRGAGALEGGQGRGGEGREG